MNLRHVHPKRLLLGMLTVTEALCIMVQAIVQGSLQNLMMYALWAETAGILLITLWQNRRRSDGDLIWILLICAVFVLSISCGDGSRSAAIVGFLEFFAMLMPLYWARGTRLTDGLRRLIRCTSIVKALFFFILSFTAKAYAPYYVNNIAIADGSLTLGYGNPNITAVFLLNSFAVLLSTQPRAHRLPGTALLAILALLIFKTQSRIAMVCVAFLILLALFGRRTFVRRILTSRRTAACFIAWPLAFIAVFYFLYRTQPGLRFMGAGIFARIQIYDRVLASLKQHPLLGDACSWHFQNSHNGMLTILANTGALGLGLYIVYMFRRLSGYACRLRRNPRLNILPYFMLLTCFLHACVETTVLTGSVLHAAELSVICLLCEDGASLPEGGRT